MIQSKLNLVFLDLLECHNTKKIDMHHLKKSSDSHPYQMRVTVFAGKNRDGQRITIPLNTHDVELAARSRDCVIHALKAMGVYLTNKRQ